MKHVSTGQTMVHALCKEYGLQRYGEYGTHRKLYIISIFNSFFVVQYKHHFNLSASCVSFQREINYFLTARAKYILYLKKFSYREECIWRRYLIS